MIIDVALGMVLGTFLIGALGVGLFAGWFVLVLLYHVWVELFKHKPTVPTVHLNTECPSQEDLANLEKWLQENS